MKNLVIAACLLSMLALTGCVGTANVPAQKNRLAQTAGFTLSTSSRPLPAFADMKPTNAMFGAIGGLASVASGNELVKKNGVKDPAVEIAAALADHLAGKFKIISQSGVPVSVDTNDTQELVNAAKGKADLLLDVQTLNWMCIYLPLKWTRYRVMYSVKLRLIDVRKQEMIAEGFFQWKAPEGANPPTYDELFENGAAGLRKELEQASKAAIDHFKTQILIEKG